MCFNQEITSRQSPENYTIKMSQKFNINSDLKSETNRLGQDNETIASKYNDLNAASSSSSKQTHHHHHHHHHNYLNGEISKEDTKSHRLRNGNFHSLSQHSQLNLSQEMQSNNNNSNSNNNLNQRYGQNMFRSTTSPLLNQNPPFQHVALSSKQSIPKSENLNRYSAKQKAPPSSSSSMINNIMGFSQSSSAREEYRSAHNSRQDQQDRETNEVVTMIREELEDNPEDGFKESELETLGSLERNLPVELSFLIRQQAYCMARMNYLDRQIRELKEVRQTNVPHQQANSTSNIANQSHRNTTTAANTTTTATTTTHTKNGNFIPSDDSGGEYSRATISDDDELSSLLDQIAKSVRPERNVNPNVRQANHSRTNYSVTSNQPQPQYAIINPAQLHQQAVPVFVMGSPITLAHPSSISSNVLPGVHFQPEARYNQYYEEFYAPNNSSTLHRPNNNGIRLQQFDNSISAIEQLVSQKEKRQITSQLKSADNWLKMRSSGLCNLNSNYSNTNNRTSNGDGTGSVNDRNLAASSAPDNSNSVIEENRGR